MGVGKMKTENEEEKKTKLLEMFDKSIEFYKKAFNTEIKKYRFLPNWVNYKGYMLHKEDERILLSSTEDEKEKQRKKKYYYYKYGTIVRVDFGVNIGSEFSGLHFAITLNKKDNAENPIITVVPLTSKFKKQRLPLGKEVFSQTLDHLDKTYDGLLETITDCQAKIEELRSIENISKETRDAKSNEIGEALLKVGKDLFEVKKVGNIYKKYNKDSFVRANDITTISKNRIKPINKFDPSGKIKLQPELMAEINKELLTLFIKS
ncbi:hypothetical protein GUM07_04060 [Listeria monocytogenes]|nr:hypothetical protein [Listeria monocytogenes]